MSFILDALKKSENERQRQAGPGFATVPESSGSRPRKVWPFVVAVLLAVNLVVIGAVLMRDRPGTTDETPTARPVGPVPDTRPKPEPSPSGTQLPAPPRATTSTPSAVAQPAREHAGSQAAPAAGPESGREVRPLAKEVTGGESVAAAAGGGDDERVEASPTPGPAPVAAAAPRQRSTSPEKAPSSSVESLPTANDLRLEGFLTGPPLHLDLHVYYPDHQRRMVFISGSKYREGDTVKGGALVREIVPEGVILEERGRRYLLMPD